VRLACETHKDNIAEALGQVIPTYASTLEKEIVHA